MNLYKRNGKWIVETRGGFRNNDHVPADVLPLSRYAPQVRGAWRENNDTSCGTGISDFVQYEARVDADYVLPELSGVTIHDAPQANGRGPQRVVRFSVRDFGWDPAWGYSWAEGWESIHYQSVEPPVLGEAYELSTPALASAIRSIQHPQAAA